MTVQASNLPQPLICTFIITSYTNIFSMKKGVLYSTLSLTALDHYI